MPQIPGYKILHELGSGSSGRVFLAEHRNLERRVALKLLSPGLFDAAETLARFGREARLQASLDHPNIVQVYDAGMAGDAPYLVAELVAGGNLRARLDEKGPFSASEVLRLGAAVAAGREHAHQAGIVHRDLKPENILFTEDGLPKIADFGLARAESSKHTLQTRHGLIVGTPGYLAPEVLEGARAEPAADVYALGVLLWEMAYGRRMFRGRTPGEILQRQAESLRAPAQTVGPEFAPEVRQLHLRCLSARPQDRPGSGEVAAALAASKPTGEAAKDHTVQLSMRRPAAAGRDASTMALGTARTVTRTAVVIRQPRLLVPALAAGGALVLAAALAAVLLLRVERRPNASVSVVPPAASAISPAKPPDPHMAITVGSSTAHLWFDPPPSSDAELALRLRGQSRALVQTLAAGTSDRMLGQLKHGVTYDIELRGRFPPHRTSFLTLPDSREPHSARLGRSLGELDSMAAASHGHNVAVSWLSPIPGNQSGILLRESHDSGLTWGEAQRLESSSGNGMVRLSALWLPTGLLVAYNRHPATAVLRFRPTGQHQWSAPLTIPCDRPGPVIAAESDSTVHLVTCTHRDGRSHLNWRRLTVPKMQLGRAALAGLADPGALNWLGLAAAGRRPFLFYRGLTNEKTNGAMFLTTATPEAGPWPARRDLSLVLGDLERPTVAALGDKVALVTTDQMLLTFLAAAPPYQQFERVPYAPQQGYLPWLSSVIPAQGRFLAATIEWSNQNLVNARVQTFGTADLKTCQLGARMRIRPTIQAMLRLAPVPGGAVMFTQSILDGIVAHPLPEAAR